ncbi:helix-turn-helix domain-containing protein [Pelagicoccus sp. SDUM812003]|uniref:helix-turn-helix domain-containing protein n=1 Tax=Pelagicoccus sp. SDUM812003 TaxID=3041267 RepID=UPI00280DEEB1|nr:helix-turn-helix domain-containing protein [Pelagicoccus sp. SDUM812003]MDQ8202782.1 helix-turn-helix domain-containing protein [Pelagicoccus sp. SDUM812003]
MTAFEYTGLGDPQLSIWPRNELGSFGLRGWLIEFLSVWWSPETSWLRKLATSESLYCLPMKKPKADVKNGSCCDSKCGGICSFLKGILGRLDRLIYTLECLLQFKDYMTHSAAAKYVCLSERQLHEYKDAEKISFARLGRKIVYRKKDLDTFINERLNRSE